MEEILKDFRNELGMALVLRRKQKEWEKYLHATEYYESSNRPDKAEAELLQEKIFSKVKYLSVSESRSKHCSKHCSKHYTFEGEIGKVLMSGDLHYSKQESHYDIWIGTLEIIREQSQFTLHPYIIGLEELRQELNISQSEIADVMLVEALMRVVPFEKGYYVGTDTVQKDLIGWKPQPTYPDFIF